MVSIVIMAGGGSNRMGQNKALMPFLGEPLLKRVARRLAGVGDELWAAANGTDELSALQLPIKTDSRPGLGALGGLYTALSKARYELVVVVACDMPFVNPNLLKIQIEMLRAEAADVVIPRLPEGFEPMHAVYRKRTCLPAVEQALQSEQRRMISWFGAVIVREMQPEEIRRYDVEMRSFMNINDPVQFAAAERLARSLEEDK